MTENIELDKLVEYLELHPEATEESLVNLLGREKADELLRLAFENKLIIKEEGRLILKKKSDVPALGYKGIKLLKPIELKDVKLIYEHLNKLVDSNGLCIEPIFKIYEVFLGSGNKPIYVKVEPWIRLEKVPEACLVQEELGNCEKIILHRLVDINDLYKLTSSLTEEELDKILSKPEEEFNQILEDFINEGSRSKDVILKKWAKANSIIISKNKADHWLTDFRGHSIIIKPSGAGFSYLATKTGICIAWASSVSGRGYKTANIGEERTATLDGQFGGITYDEFTKYHDPVPESMFNFLQFGESTTDTGSGILINKGTPKVSFVANAGKIIATPTEMMSAFDTAIGKLSPSSPEALAPRFVLIFRKSIKDPKENANWLDKEEILLNKILVSSLLDYAIKPLNKIWKSKEVLKWLSEHDADFKNSVRILSEKSNEDIFYEKARLFIQDAWKCNTHLKGCALEEACFDSLRIVLINRKNIVEEVVQQVLDLAKEKYEEWKSIVLSSIFDMIKMAEQTPRMDIVRLKFENLKPFWLKSLIIGYKKSLDDGIIKKNEPTPLSIILQSFENVPLEERKNLVGELYSFISKVAQKIPQNRSHIEDKIFALFGIESTTVKEEWAWFTDSDEIEFIPYGIGKQGNSGNSNSKETEPKKGLMKY